MYKRKMLIISICAILLQAILLFENIHYLVKYRIEQSNCIDYIGYYDIADKQIDICFQNKDDMRKFISWEEKNYKSGSIFSN